VYITRFLNSAGDLIADPDAGAASYIHRPLLAAPRWPDLPFKREVT